MRRPGAVADPVTAPEADIGLETTQVLGAPASRRQSKWVTIGSYVVTVFILITFNFALPRLMPGDPIDALMALSATTVLNEDTRGALEQYYNLDEPLLRQYLSYMNGLVHGDLGVSIVSNRPVIEELGKRVGWSLLLLLSASGIAMLIGLPLGIHSGWKRGKGVDRTLLGFFLAVQNLPIFILGSLVFIVFIAKWGLFPYGSATTPLSDYHGLSEVADIIRHVALPAMLLSFDFVTYEYLVMRSSMVGELGSDYLLAGRAKGLRERRLKYRYAGRNALLPVVTVIGLQFSLAIGAGLIIIEGIFSYPGVGGYMLGAVGTRDYPAMQGAFLVLTVGVVTTNLVVDLLYRRLDPRVGT